MDKEDNLCDRGENLVSMLLKYKANVNDTDTQGKTALMLASELGRFKIVSLLLHNQADVNLQEGNGKTAFMIAAEQGHDQVVKLLLRFGTSIDNFARLGQDIIKDFSMLSINRKKIHLDS